MSILRKLFGESLQERWVEPRNDRVLIRRIDEQKGPITLTDPPKGSKGTVLAVGPGKFDEDGDFWPTTVKPGEIVLFNSKWNDFAKDYYDDLPLGADPTLHLVQEADILARFG